MQTSHPAEIPNHLPCLGITGGGEMGALIRAFNWSLTSVGPITEWPQSLKTAVNIVLQSPVPMVMLWGTDGIMIYNDAYSVFAGKRHPDLLGSKVLEGWAEVADFNRNVMETGLAGKTLSYQNQQLTLYRHGMPEAVYMDLNYSPLLDESGQPAGVLAIVTETTQRVLAEQAVREREARFRIMADASPTFIWALEPDGSLAYLNRFGLEFFDTTLEAMIAHNWMPYLHPDDVETASQALQKAIANRSNYRHEHRIRKPNGSCHWVLSSAAPSFLPDGELYGYIGSSVDITERKHLEQRLELIIEGSNDGIWEWDYKSDKAWWNDRMSAILGLDIPEENRSLSAFQHYIHPDDLQIIPNTLAAHQGGKPYEAEFRWLHPDGGTRCLLTRGTVVFDDTGHPDRLYGTLTDITIRKQSEEALKESESRFRALADSAPLFIWMGGIDGQANYVNKTWTDFLGMSDEEAVRHGLNASMLPDEQSVARIQYREALQNKQPYSIEARFRRHDGEMRWLLSKGAPLFLPNGGLTGYIGTSIDITDRKEAENRLQSNLEQEQLIRRIVEIIGQSFDIDLILQTVAEELGRYLGADRSSITRYCFNEGEISINLSAQYWNESCKPVDPEDIEILTNAFRKLSPDTIYNTQEQIVNIPDPEQYIQYLEDGMNKAFPDGLPDLSTERLIDIVRKYDVQSSLRVNVFYRGTPYGSLSVSQCTHNRIWTPDEVNLLKTIADHAGSAIYQAELYRQAQETAVKEQKSREEMEIYAKKLETSNQELEQFTIIASHDLSEPLRKIQVFSEMLNDKVMDEGKDYLQRMNSAANRMQTLMDDLLTLSRVNRKGKPFKPVDLNHIVHTVLDDLQFAIQESGATISSESLPTVYADESQMRQLFQNLIGNAIKYRREAISPIVRIESSRSGNHCRMTIADNGIGIKEEHIARIFEPFKRLHGMEKYPGTGMGLAIVKKIIERHGGSISVQSEPETGSQFIFTLPLQNALSD